MENEFLHIATADLKVSKLAFDDGIYRNAVFSLQQSNEKLLKCFQICVKIADMSELRRASHDPFKPLLKWLKKETTDGRSNIDILKQRYNTDESGIIGSDLRDAIDMIDSAIELTNEVKFKSAELKSSEEFIVWHLNSLEEMLETDVNYNFKVTREHLSSFDIFHHMPFLKNYPDWVVEWRKSIEEEQFDEVLEFLNKMLQFLISFVSPYVIMSTMNMLLNHHAGESRYPNPDAPEHFTYDDNHPIIRHYLRFYRLTEIAVNGTDNMLENLKNFYPASNQDKQPAPLK